MINYRYMQGQLIQNSKELLSLHVLRSLYLCFICQI